MTDQVGIVLSGGGYKGAAHIGLLKAFEECGISIHKVSGSSAGAIVGALFCAGYTSDEILKFFKSNTELFSIKHIFHKKPGLFDSDLKREIFDEYLPQDSFASLEKELNICVTNVLKGKVQFFSSGELIRVLLASAALPGIFTPVEIDGVYYFDGGTMNNFPVEPLTGRCDWLYGSYVSVRKEMQPKEISSIMKVIDRASNLALLANSDHKFHLCDHVFYPHELGKYETLNSKYIDEMYQIGYEFTLKQIGELREMKRAPR